MRSYVWHGCSLFVLSSPELSALLVLRRSLASEPLSCSRGSRAPTPCLQTEGAKEQRPRPSRRTRKQILIRIPCVAVDALHLGALRVPSGHAALADQDVLIVHRLKLRHAMGLRDFAHDALGILKSWERTLREGSRERCELLLEHRAEAPITQRHPILLGTDNHAARPRN